MKVQPKEQRVQRWWKRHRKAPVYGWAAVADPRCPRGRRYSLPTMLDRLLEGMLVGCPSLRDVEELTEQQGRRVADTTMYELCERLSVEPLRRTLRQQVRTLWRSKSLEPEGLPCGVLSIDGKGLGALEHDANGTAQKGHRVSDGAPYWLSRVLRAVLTSAGAKPCVDQRVVPAVTNEMGVVEAFFDEVLAAYGTLFEVVTLDAGLISRAIADHIDGKDKAYVAALKHSQPELRAEAERLLCPSVCSHPNAQTPWERVQGRWVRRRLYRTNAIAGYHDWTHLRQAWLVVTDVREDDGREHVLEERFFVTNLHVGRLTPEQILQVVRGHWGIENDCFWSLDMQWREDQRPWCTRGHAVEVLGLLRLMAYNVLQLLRKRHLRERNDDGTRGLVPSWRTVFVWVGQALRQPHAWSPLPTNG